MDSGLKLWGIMGSSAIVLSNDSPTLVKAAARLAKVVFGARIQICDSIDDQVKIQAAIDALPTGTKLQPIIGAVADDGGAQTDEKTAAENSTGNDMTLLPGAPVVNDAYYFEGKVRFNKLRLNIGTAGSAPTLTLTWEYWNGAWVALAGVTDGTSNFTNAGTYDVTFTMPNDWKETQVLSRGYWMRARLSAFVDGTYVQPLGTQVWVEVDDGGGSIKLSEGGFDIRDNIASPSNISIMGCGNNTILRIPDANNGTFGIFQNADTVGGNYNIVIADMLLEGNRDHQTGGVQRGILFDTVDWCEIRNLTVQNFYCPISGGIRSDKQVNNSIIAHNVLRNNSDDNLCFHYASYNVIEGNRSEAAGDSGFCLSYGSDGNTLTGNICRSNDWFGIRIDESNWNTLSGNDCSYNKKHGIYLYPGTNGSFFNNIVANICIYNKRSGIYFETGGANCCYNNIVGNTCSLNTEKNGILLEKGCNYNNIVGNHAKDNGAHGIHNYRASHNNIIGNLLYGNTDNILIEGAVGETSDYNQVQANVCRDGGGRGVYVKGNSNKNVIRGNDLYNNADNLLDYGTCTTVKDNRGEEVSEVKDYAEMQNTSGVNLVAGDVVVFKAVAAGNQFDIPNAVGMDNVWGMLAEDIDNNAWGYVQTLGKTTILNATNAVGGNIAIGDFLCTENAGGASPSRAIKAAAGNMAFAIALEVCAVADADIDALIVKPMKI